MTALCVRQDACGVCDAEPGQAAEKQSGRNVCDSPLSSFSLLSVACVTLSGVITAAAAEYTIRVGVKHAQQCRDTIHE